MLRKESFIIFIAVILSMILCSCGGKNILHNEEGSQRADYSISKVSYSEKNVVINYPQLYNLSDINRQNSINRLIKNEALKVLNYYNSDIDSLTLEISYDIHWKGNNLLSIQYWGTGFNEGAAHPNNLLYTTNINMVSPSKVILADVINIDERFIKKFRSGEFKLFSPQLHDKAFIISSKDMYSLEELIGLFKNADSLDYVGTEKQSDIFSFFTKDALCISIPVSHAAGDHAELGFEYKSISDIIKGENNIWQDFKKEDMISTGTITSSYIKLKNRSDTAKSYLCSKYN
ncbi:MAG TPA: hypothetical protein VIO64_04490 [Pseudobacteroides sp.]|uniref:hypothetical protein n=1 Tax=Pseudobacteroides sp. TaxID=1968840 RepID=UPI002F91C516